MRDIDRDYLFVGERLLARLREQLADVVHGDDIRPIEDIAQALASPRPAVVFVLWDGDQFSAADATEARAGAARQAQQLWSVLLSVRNASQVDDDARARQAGPLLSLIHRSVAGWAPAGCVRPFSRIQGRAAQYSGLSSLYPLTFSIPVHL